MKGILVVLVAVCCATQLKAQQAPVFPKKQFGPLKPQLKSFTDSLKKDGFSYNWMDTLGKSKANNVLKQNLIADANIDNMPVARPHNNSKMPVVQTDVTGYNMPVVGMNLPQLYMMNKPNERQAVKPENNKDVKR